jgi:crossover junction endodeoxyribonuclease RusA
MRLEIPGRPVPKARPRRAPAGHFYTPSTTRAYEEDVAWYARLSRVRFDGAVKVTAEFYMRPPRGDTDNLVKAVNDGLQKGGVIRDDVEIVEFHGKRIEVERPEDEKTVVEVLAA